MFWTAVNELKSPENAGMIVRSHVAFGGQEILIIGSEPWHFKKRTQGFSRRLERLCRFIYLEDEESFFQWCRGNSVIPIAIEIVEPPTLVPEFDFPNRAAIVMYELTRRQPLHRGILEAKYSVEEAERP
jgi:hypothetical protein